MSNLWNLFCIEMSKHFARKAIATMGQFKYREVGRYLILAKRWESRAINR